MARIRVGVVGLGSMGRHHTRVLRENPDFEVVALVDPNGDQYEIAGQQEVYSSVERMISEGIEAAVVAVPTGHHEDVCLELAEAGVHVLVEKPIADNVRSGERIASTFADKGLIGAVGYVERSNAAVAEMRSRIEEGQLGAVLQIATVRQNPYPARITDVGVVKDLATHDVDLTRWLAESEYESINAQVIARSGTGHEDMVVAAGRLENGALVSHVVNWLAPFKERTTTVIGERGAFVADTARGDLTYFANATVPAEWDTLAAFRGPSEGDVTRYAFPKPEPLATQARSFASAIKGDTSRIVSMEEGVRTLEVIEDILASASTK